MADIWFLTQLKWFTFQVLPSQRAAIIRTEARAAARSNHSICQQAHTLSLYTSLLYRETVYTCAAVYLSVYAVAYTEEIKLSSTNMWWIYTGVWVWEISAFSFLFGISIWTMHHQLAKRAVIVVIISVYPCLLRRNNQCLNQWSPPSIYFTTTTPSDVLYLIRKSGGEKPAYNKMKLWHLLGIILYLSICHWRNWKLRIFSCIKLTTWTYLKCAKSYLSSLVNVNTLIIE